MNKPAKVNTNMSSFGHVLQTCAIKTQQEYQRMTTEQQSLSAFPIVDLMNGVDICRFITAYVVWVTPEVATRWFRRRHPTKQREIRESRVKRWLMAMNNGKWIEDAEPICFDCNGYLVQGQHRLSAIIKHGKPIKMLVIFGLSEKAIEGMDRGDGRSKADRGIASGVLSKGDNPKFASIAAWLVKIDMGVSYKTYDDEEIDYLVDYKEEIKRIFENAPRKGNCTSSAILAALAYLCRAYPKEAVTFTRKLAGTEAKIASDPADKLLNGIPSGTRPELQLQYTFAAFEKHLVGSPMKNWPPNLSSAMNKFKREINGTE